MTPGSGRKALTELIVTMVAPGRPDSSGIAARIVRTAARKLIVSAHSQSASVSATNPSSRGRTAPTLLTRMSMPPSAAVASAMSSPGPSGVVRSTETGRTSALAPSSSSSALPRRAPATTDTPSPASARVIARPMPLLAPVTTAVRPVRPRSISETLGLQPGQGLVGDVAPAVVDREGVGAVLELEDLGDCVAVAVLLERRLGDRLRHRVVLAAHDQQQRAAARVVGGDLGRRVRVEVRGGRLEERLARRRDGPLLEETVGLL